MTKEQVKEELRTVIGANIRRERKSRGISIDELGSMLNLSPSFVGLIERGHRGTTIVTLLKLSDMFEMPIDAFFYPKGDYSPKLAGDSMIDIKRQKLAFLTSDFSDMELDFVISSVKGLRGIYRSNATEDDIGDFENDEDYA